MANTKQARKRVKQNEAAKLRNRAVKSEYRTFTKQFLAQMAEGKHEDAAATLKVVESKVDRAAKRNVIHHATANRIKSRLKAKLSAAAS